MLSRKTLYGMSYSPDLFQRVVKTCKDGGKFTDVMTSFGKKCTFLFWVHEPIMQSLVILRKKKNLNQNKNYGPILAPTYITLPWIKAGVILASQSLMRYGISRYLTRICVN